MTEHEPLLTPAQEEAVRRRLAEARHTDPVPPDIAARLDNVLTELARERPTPQQSIAPVVTLAARRRRRAAMLLVAAAATVAVGLTVPALLDRTGGGSDADSSAAESTASQDPGAADSAGVSASPVRIRPRRFAEDVAAARDLVLASTVDGLDRPTEGTPEDPCGPSPGAGDVALAVRYDGDAGVLLVRRARNGEQRVDLYLCDSDEPLRSVALPAR